MVATLSVDALVVAAARVGVTLNPTVSGGNLYVWHTPEGEVVYIGKSASNKRTSDEIRWSNKDPREGIYSGIMTLLRANKAQLQPLMFLPEEFDSSAWRRLADTWEGPIIASLREDLADRALTVEEVEVLLVRICVRYGIPIGNSQFASQWENPIGTSTDTLAAMSVHADETFRP